MSADESGADAPTTTEGQKRAPAYAITPELLKLRRELGGEGWAFRFGSLPPPKTDGATRPRHSPMKRAFGKNG